MIVLLSGGIDSTTLLHSVLRDYKCVALSFAYDQTHRKELDYAKATTQRFGVEHVLVNLPDIFWGSALTGDRPMPHGHYTDASMRQTVVPNRNMVFLAIATSLAIQREISVIAYAAHADDYGTYPDCRPDFVMAMQEAMGLCDFSMPKLLTPFLTWKKKEIVAFGRSLGIDYDQTWSCYAGGEYPCGTCGACSARQEALA